MWSRYLLTWRYYLTALLGAAVRLSISTVVCKILTAVNTKISESLLLKFPVDRREMTPFVLTYLCVDFMGCSVII